MRTTSTLLLAALALLPACAPAAQASRLRDSQTIHNADATRIWIIHDVGGAEHVIYCDAALLQPTRQLCVRWPQ
jgi:hypothetical protein